MGRRRRHMYPKSWRQLECPSVWAVLVSEYKITMRASKKALELGFGNHGAVVPVEHMHSLVAAELQQEVLLRVEVVRCHRPRRRYKDVALFFAHRRCGVAAELLHFRQAVFKQF